jgi:hypothetical protein
MPELPLPYKSEPFSPEGFERLYEPLRKDHAAAKVIADEIEANPKRVIEHAFTLSKEQQEHFDKASDQELKRQARVLIDELRTEEPGPVQLISSTWQERDRKDHHKLVPCHNIAPLP